MLLTEPGWAEALPTRRLMVHPYLPWRCLGISAESPCFLIGRSQPQNEERALLSNFLVPSAEYLLEVMAQVSDQGYRVYRLELGEGEVPSRLAPICALKSYRAGGVIWFSYLEEDGVMRPCLPWQPPPADRTEWTTEWTYQPVPDIPVRLRQSCLK